MITVANLTTKAQKLEIVKAWYVWRTIEIHLDPYADWSDNYHWRKLLHQYNAQNEQFREQADETAAEQTGYVWDIMTMVSNPNAEAYNATRKAEFERMLSEVIDDRIEAFAALLPVEVHISFRNPNSIF